MRHEHDDHTRRFQELRASTDNEGNHEAFAAYGIDSFTCEEALHNQFEWHRLLIENDHHRMMIPGTEEFGKEDSRDGKGGIFISFEERWDIGMVPAYRLRLHLWGLKLAHEQCERRLSAEEMQKL